MTSDKLSQFTGQKYLNLESYRKNGNAVATPVWFAEDGGELYIYSLADAGKVKRIRNNPRVRVVPCDARGKLKGEWIEARARILDGAEAEKGHRLLDEKYGLLKKIGNVFSKLMKRERVVIAIKLD
ncbi:MAG: PPOX class F420-dependent oxidoreductase [Acidobacteriota bacterium]